MKRIFQLILVCLAFHDCQDSNEKTSASVVEFDYHSTRDVTLSAYFTDTQGNYLPKIPYEISATSTFNSSSRIAIVSTGTNGHDEFAFNIPTALDTIFVHVNYEGVPSRWKVPVEGGSIDWSRATPINEPTRSFKSNSQQNGRVESLPFTLNYFGAWDSFGLPDYLLPTGDRIDAALLSRINASLPESKNLTLSNPDYFTSEDKSIEITANAEVWITFISEGAGFLNSLGYYVYNKASPPQSIADVKSVTIVFPNASFAGSGGNLKSGDKVYLGKFQRGQVIGWALFSNGFSNKVVTQGNGIYFSNQALNSFNADAASRQQNVLLNDVGNGGTILGFEDTRRDDPLCDQDFNDVLFLISSNPVSAINKMPLYNLSIAGDFDKDGVNDAQDAYPTDPARAYNQYFPAQDAFNTLAYEDLWPSRGDYDFNDLVIAYNAQEVLSASNHVVDVKMTYQLRAVGGSYKVGFAVQLPVSTGNLSQVVQVPPYVGNSLLINGAEEGQSNLVFPLFDDAHRVIRPSGGSFTNTVEGTPYITPSNFSLSITFTSPVAQSVLGSAPYNSFIFVNDRTVEVHLPNQVPTDKANVKLFGTSSDHSQPALGKYYLTNDNKPWGLLIPGDFDYPVEKSSIESTYYYFDPWATSIGTQLKDWYSNNNGYRDESKIYKH